jgi:glycosyltransferase involved in cell wall biosynthesis
MTLFGQVDDSINDSAGIRLLFLSNYYPPYARGGYEQWCQEVATALTQRGHEVHVLTSRVPGEATAVKEDGVWVHRLLHLEVEGGLWQTAVRLLKDRTRLEQENLANVEKLIADFQPDVAMMWGMWNVPRSVPALVERLLPNRVAYYLCDYWLSLPGAYIQQLQAPARSKLTHWPKRLVGRFFLPKLLAEPAIDLQLEHPVCVSQAVRHLLVEAGVPIAGAEVVYGGTQVEEFVTAAQPRERDHVFRLLYIGRLTPEKGVRTAVTAIKQVQSQNGSAITLDIVGAGDPDFEADLKIFVQKNKLNVFFRGRVPRSEIPGLLSQYDALIFPSEWEEPFARTVLEAMAAGLVVIGTTTGGTGEILVDGEIGLTFAAGDETALARQIQRLLNDTTLYQRLAGTGQQRIMEGFDFLRMVDEIETILQRLIAVSEKEG